MSKTARLELRVEPELLARIDAARGDVPRARWVQRALEQALPETQFTAENGAPVKVRPVKRAATLAETWAR